MNLPVLKKPPPPKKKNCSCTTFENFVKLVLMQTCVVVLTKIFVLTPYSQYSQTKQLYSYSQHCVHTSSLSYYITEESRSKYYIHADLQKILYGNDIITSQMLADNF